MQLGDKVLFRVPFERASLENQREPDRLAIITRIYPRERMANGQLGPQYYDVCVLPHYGDRTHPFHDWPTTFGKVTEGQGPREIRPLISESVREKK